MAAPLFCVLNLSGCPADRGGRAGGPAQQADCVAAVELCWAAAGGAGHEGAGHPSGHDRGGRLHAHPASGGALHPDRGARALGAPDTGSECQGCSWITPAYGGHSAHAGHGNEARLCSLCSRGRGATAPSAAETELPSSRSPAGRSLPAAWTALKTAPGHQPFWNRDTVKQLVRFSGPGDSNGSYEHTATVFEEHLTI